MSAAVETNWFQCRGGQVYRNQAEDLLTHNGGTNQHHCIRIPKTRTLDLSLTRRER